jgi:hypothetical protein
MAFLLNGRTLSPDAAFEHNGFLYPANWLRLSTPEEKAALGIVEVSDMPQHDQRFYWGLDQEGMPIAKDLEQLRDQWLAVVKETAGQMLAQTDWMVIRQMDTGVEMPLAVRELRNELRAAANDKELALLQVQDVEALKEFVTGPDFFAWPKMAEPEQPTPEQPQEDSMPAELLEPMAEEQPEEEQL